MSHAVVPAPRPRLVRSPWFLFHLCDLDAPAVAVAWQLLFAKSFGVPLRVPAVLALALSVWLIYAADRLLDVLPSRRAAATTRHRFHGAYWRNLLVAAGIAMVLLAVTCSLLRPPVLQGGLLLGCGIVLYMCAVHLLPQAAHKAVPKEVNVGLLFAVGTCLAPASFYGLRFSLVLPGAVFAGLCCLNCCAIEVWEWNPYSSGTPAPHAFTRWSVKWLQAILWTVIILAGTLLFTVGHESLYAALVLSALGFCAVVSLQGRISTDLLRVLVDLPLLSPLIFLLLPAR